MTKSITIIFCFIIIVLMVLAVSNPKREEHVSKVELELKDYFNSKQDEGLASIFQSFIGNYMAKEIAEKKLITYNFIIFSSSGIKIDNEYKCLSFGILGNVFLFFDKTDIEKIESKIKNNYKDQKEDNFIDKIRKEIEKDKK